MIYVEAVNYSPWHFSRFQRPFMILSGYGSMPNGSRDATFVTKIIGPAKTFRAIAGQRFRNKCSFQVAERCVSDWLEMRELVIDERDDAVFIKANH